MSKEQSDRAYYRQRSTTEWEAARRGTDPRVVACHLELARHYDLLAQFEDYDRPAIPLRAA